MSLFVGNISSRVRHSDLERAFRRFGRSNLELKDGYGFVVYDTVGDAEKALRALKGRNICGEQPSITWARKRRPLGRFSGKGFPPSRGYGNRNLRKVDNDMKGVSSQEWEETSKDAKKHEIYEEEGVERNDFSGKEGRGNDLENDIGEDEMKHQNLQEAALVEGCMAEPIPLENDRWGEPISEASNEHDMAEEATDFQRYEPYSADSRREGDPFVSEKYRRAKSSDSYAEDSSPERILKHRSRDETRSGHSGYGKSPEGCYICGRIGHVMRQCRARPDVSRRDSFMRFGARREGERNFRGNGFTRFRRPRDSNWSRRDFSREAFLQRKDFSRRRSMGHVNDRRHHERTEVFSEHKRRHGRHLSEDRRASPRRERTRRGHKKLRKDCASQFARGRHRSRSSHLHSENQLKSHSNSSSSSRLQSSSSRSQSSKSLSRSGSSVSPHSDSRSSRSRTVSSHSRSQSGSSHSRSAKAVSKSRSCSTTPRSLSVSLSLDVRRSPSVSTELDHGLHGSYDVISARYPLKHALPSETQEALSEEMVHGDYSGTARMEVEDMRLAVKAENDLRVRIIQDDEKEKPVGHIDEGGKISTYENRGKKGNAYVYRKGSAELSGEEANRHIVSQDHRMKDDQARSSELETARLQIDTSMQPLVVKTSRPSGKNGDDSLLGTSDEKTVPNILLQEVDVIPKHSGGTSVEEAGHGSSMVAYLGAARLWPWEAIHYRRSMRGPISTANYARRMAQNEAFGIVDKYIRSSSGWWENESREF